ncbi:MAG TPA: Imm8 family immunity protein [Iamia sp.]
MRPVLRASFSPDVEDLESFAPPADAPWSVYVVLLVGPDGSEGEESFGVTICNALWLEDKAKAIGVLLGRHHLVMPSFDWARAQAFIDSFLARCDGDTWPAVAARVGRLGYWEFEDYQP